MMRMSGVRISIAVIAILVLAGFSYTQVFAQKPQDVRWLVSHKPSVAYERAIEVFAETLSKESNGELRLVVVHPDDIGLDAEGDVPSAEVARVLAEGKAELASDYTIPLGRQAPEFWSLNLPFRFSSYEEVSAYLDGADGKAILDTLTTARALAFTMSGGFRVIASKNTVIDEVDDLAGLRIGTSGGPVAEATLLAVGAIPVPLDLESGPVDVSDLDGLETAYARLSLIVGSDSEYLQYINETNHSVFLTAIIASNAFYDSLSTEEQAALRTAALAAAAVERQDSEALNATTKQKLIEAGSVITELSPSERSVFVEKVRNVTNVLER